MARLSLGSPDTRPYGNGVVLWFCEPEVFRTYDCALAQHAEAIEALKVNPLANHQEFWLHDPNGYVVVVAGIHGDVG